MWFQVSKRFIFSLRVSSLERRNEIKAVWDFIWVWKSHFGAQSALYLCSYELRRNEARTGMDFTSVIFGQNELSNWHEILMSKKITRSEMNKRRFCVLLRLMRMCVKSALRALFHFGHFDRKKSFQVIIYHGNTTQNKMPKHFHQKIGSFRNTAEMKRHRNRTSFQTGLKSHTGLSSSRLSYKRTLSPVTKHLGM